jgi:zinc/manganese transport system permease protein
MDVFTFLLVPFIAGLILTGIHAYLGLHVVERGVIFVDLSLAQIAALGTTIAYLAGYDLHARATYFWSLGFTFIGAAIFALTRTHRDTRIPQEAIIGIVYAVSAAAAILAMSKAPEGTEHLKDMLVGNILTVSWHEVIITAILYAVVGAFHYIFRHKFLAISLDAEAARASGLNVRFWDFLFYTSFGFVVTSSVAIAGVLLVFSYLVVPSVAAMLFARTIGRRLALGWIMGALVSALGVILSFQLDLPTGATIVCTFGIALAALALVRLLSGAPLARALERRRETRGDSEAP